MKGLAEILNWKLLKGSHGFPGPAGGTCINEAAIVVAGFPYQEVTSSEDLPKCFCPVIGTYALHLNDALPDAERQKLIPFVTRLAGSADTKIVQRQRIELIVNSVINELLLPALENQVRLAQTRLIGAYRAATNQTVREAILDQMWDHMSNGSVRNCTELARASLDYMDLDEYGQSISAIIDCAMILYSKTGSNKLLVILDQALKIGKQAEPIEISTIKDRACKAKADAALRAALLVGV